MFLKVFVDTFDPDFNSPADACFIYYYPSKLAKAKTLLNIFCLSTSNKQTNFQKDYTSRQYRQIKFSDKYCIWLG